MIGRMVISSIAHRPVRTGLSILAIAVEVTMILLIVGLADGLLEESQGRTRSVGADILIRPSSSGVAMGLTTADIPEGIARVLVEKNPEIAMAVGTTVYSGGDLQTITGVDWERFTEMCGGVRYAEGGPMSGPGEAIVDEVYARYKKVAVGDTLELLNREFRVAGVVEPGKMSRVFIPIETMQELLGWQGNYSQVFVRLHDPEQTGEVVEKIQALLPGYPVYPIEEFLTLAAADIQEVSRQVTDAIVGIAVIIGFIVVLLSMYTSVIERTREIGILKSLGASKGYIVGILLREALLLCAAGIVAGFGLSYLVRSIVIDRFPLVSVLISADWLVMSAVLAVIGATLGSLYPAIRAARQDTIQSLTYD